MISHLHFQHVQDSEMDTKLDRHETYKSLDFGCGLQL